MVVGLLLYLRVTGLGPVRKIQPTAKTIAPRAMMGLAIGPWLIALTTMGAVGAEDHLAAGNVASTTN